MEYSIYSRIYKAFSPLDNELNYHSNQNYLFDLDYLSIMRVHGDRASDFLQGQLSCDLNRVNHTQVQQGVMCNIQGRILALLDVILMSNGHYTLMLANDLMNPTKVALEKVAALSKVNLQQDQSYKIYGLYCKHPVNFSLFGLPIPENQYACVQNELLCIYKIDEFFYMIVVNPSITDELIAPFINQQTLRGSLAWRVLQLQHQRPEIYPETRGLLLPHRLDLHQHGYLNFQKGCYKGQEIIARMHYRGTQKYRLNHFITKTNTTFKAGMSVYNDENEVVGELIDYSPIANQMYLVSASVLISHGNSIKI